MRRRTGAQGAADSGIKRLSPARVHILSGLCLSKGDALQAEVFDRFLKELVYGTRYMELH
jgi:hypothetical protein